MVKNPKDKARDALRTKMRSKVRLLTGRERKDIAMKQARTIAERGGHTGFAAVLAELGRKDADAAVSLRLWASAADRDAIDFICVRWARSQPKRR